MNDKSGDAKVKKICNLALTGVRALGGEKLGYMFLSQLVCQSPD